MDPVEVLEAKSAADLGPILEVLKGQEFLYANLLHDARERTLALAVERKYPPRKGNWVLELRGVGSKRIDRASQSPGETVRDLAYDAGKGEVVLTCVRDTIRLSVDSLDVRASRYDAGAAPPKVRFEDMPESFRREVHEKRDAEDNERIRIQGMRQALLWKGTAAGGTVALLLGAMQAVLAEGRGVVDWIVLPALGTASMYFCLRTRRERLSASLYYGLTGMMGLAAGMTVINQGSLMIVFCGGLFFISIGQVIVLWIRGEETDLG